MKQLVTGIILSLSIFSHSSWAAQAWVDPDFSGQSKTLGYQASHEFKATPALAPIVNFWVKVYTQYSVNEGVIHHVDDLSKTYGMVNLDGCRTQRQKQNRIDQVKLAIIRKEAAAGRNLRMNDLRFQQGLKERMQTALFTSGKYITKMEEIFEKEGLPKELIRIIYVESSFNIKAKSKVGASGVWQIMPGTARPYRFIRGYVDLRNHPIEATKLAAKILKSNFMVLKNWPLAITAYNHGPTGMKKLALKYKTTQIEKLITHVHDNKYFGFASKNFYPTFLAALEVERNASKYFSNLKVASELKTRTIRLPRAVSFNQLVDVFDNNQSLALELNPHLSVPKNRSRITYPAKTIVTVPYERYNEALIILSKREKSIAAD